MSRIGNKPILIPPSVKIMVEGPRVAVEGPKGKLAWSLPASITARLGDGKLGVSREGDSRRARQASPGVSSFNFDYAPAQNGAPDGFFSRQFTDNETVGLAEIADATCSSTLPSLT